MCGARLGCDSEYCSLNSTRIRDGRAMAQAVSRRPLTAEARSIHVGFVVRSGTGTDFFSEIFGFPLSKFHRRSPNSCRLGDEQYVR
jgi:hypothetical protein